MQCPTWNRTHWTAPMHLFYQTSQYHVWWKGLPLSHNPEVCVFCKYGSDNSIQHNYVIYSSLKLPSRTPKITIKLKTMLKAKFNVAITNLQHAMENLEQKVDQKLQQHIDATQANKATQDAHLHDLAILTSNMHNLMDKSGLPQYSSSSNTTNWHQAIIMNPQQDTPTTLHCPPSYLHHLNIWCTCMCSTTMTAPGVFPINHAITHHTWLLSIAFSDSIYKCISPKWCLHHQYPILTPLDPTPHNPSLTPPNISHSQIETMTHQIPLTSQKFIYPWGDSWALSQPTTLQVVSKSTGTLNLHNQDMLAITSELVLCNMKHVCHSGNQCSLGRSHQLSLVQSMPLGIPLPCHCDLNKHGISPRLVQTWWHHDWELGPAE